MRVKLTVGEVVEVTAGEAVHGGWCVARPEGAPAVFVRHALPGERVLAKITDVTSRLARADAVEILTASPDRVKPPCPHARPGGCGGCDWQHAALPAQRALKAAVIRQQLRRLAALDWDVTVEPLPGDTPQTATMVPSRPSGGDPPETVTLAPSRPYGGDPPDTATLAPSRPYGGDPPDTVTLVPSRPSGGDPPETVTMVPSRPIGGGLGWRTRVQFAVGADGVAGLRAHRSHDVVDVGECLIAHPGITGLELTRRRWPGVAGVEAVIAAWSGERAVIVSPAGRGTGRSGQWEQIGAEAVLTRARGLTAVRGRGYLGQRAAGREWRVSAGAFWQVHPAAADTLSAAVLAALRPAAGDTALDLYCGAGLFAGGLAAAVGPDGTVIGVESDPAAVRDARHNLRSFPRARVHRGDVAAVLRRGGLPAARLVVADPPRSGLARGVIDYLCEPANGAERLAYVSCDPATLARDLGLLTAQGWTLAGLRAFDAFPMTHHVECLAEVVAPGTSGTTRLSASRPA
jgi:tRNA/tmRNA/rRNA uracil-C5-methylase (TrmA/RlmC/RlmD family)